VSNSAPVIRNLNGDGVTYDAGGAPVRLDALGNAAISDVDSHGFEVIRVGNGFSGGPLFMVEVPDGSGRMYVVEKSGTIRILDPATGTIAATPFLSLAGQVATAGEQGLLGFALAPDFQTSGVFYLYMTNLSGDNEVRRYSILPGNMNQADASSGDRIMLLPHPGAANHNAGWIAFGPDGMLYIATGDGAVGANAQSSSSLLGKILRIDPSSDAFPTDPDRDYAVPAGNPYAGATAGLDEIWASGLRNPFRASFDPLTGHLWIGDVGEGALEEINLAPAGQAGLNFGWNLQEGTGGANNAAFTRPVAQYGHGSGPFQGNSVTGGLVYRGPIAGLDGQYVFGDFFDEVWSVPASSIVQGSTLQGSNFTLRNTAFTPNAGTINQVTSFATDSAGHLYITDLGGEVFRVQPSAAPNFAGGSLSVEIGAGEVPAEDRLGFASGSVTLSNGTNVGSQVSIGEVFVGAIAPGGTGANGDPLIVLFSSGATPARISTLVQAVTYSNTSATPTPGTRSVMIAVNDGAGAGAGGQDTAIVTTAISVSAGAGGQLTGTAGDDVLVGGVSHDRLNGADGNDVLRLHDGGNDTADGGAGNDNIFFIGSLNAADAVNGGEGTDTLVLQGPYASLTLTANVTFIENVSILAGSNTAFGEPGTNRHDYVLTTHDSNFAAGVQARINGAALLAGEDFTFDGTAETDASFVVYGGRGRDTLTGGLGNDIFFFAEERFASGDTVNGGAGYDGLFLRGNYTIDFNAAGYAGLLTNVENLTLTSAADLRYARGGGAEFDYNITLADAIVGAGQQLTVSGALLAAAETMIVDASQELNGTLRLFGGRASDTLKGGALNDLLHGNLGADTLAGGGGADMFQYNNSAESTAGSRDQILDFAAGSDRIDLGRIDADTLTAGNQAFSWIGSNAFTGSAGQLRAYEQSGTWFVEGDTDGDGAADLVIALTLQGPTPLSAGDFLL
jgi:hypothetical protein